LLGTPLWYLGSLYAGVLRGVGNTRIAFVCALVANVVNAVLAVVLVLGYFGLPRLGVFGAALATVIAHGTNFALLYRALRRVLPKVERPAGARLVDKTMIGDLFRIGWPAALDMLIMHAGFMAALAMLGRIDQVTVAAHGLGMRVQAFVFMPGGAIAQATAALVGQALGASDVARAREVARTAMVLCFGMMSALAIALAIGASPLLSVFDVPEDSALADHAVTWLRILCLALVPNAINVALFGVLMGSGSTRTSLRINLVTMVMLQIPLAGILAFALDLGAVGVWASFPIAFLVRVALYSNAYRQGTWAVTGVRLKAKH
jgi:putative MATE family efflux protein